MSKSAQTGLLIFRRFSMLIYKRQRKPLAAHKEWGMTHAAFGDVEDEKMIMELTQ